LTTNISSDTASPASAASPATAVASPAAAAPRIVLDTNVCLDLFVFRDPRWNALLTALNNGDIEAVTREDCAWNG